ncbi:MAG: hypothetical protein EAX86_00385 [Candidatus Heimdallarchaeota archaeon]|nr:hypothetical protein [Candidatus Heimdallarchaeota archaeon]
MANLDDFFSDDQSRNVDSLIEVTKKFFIFVSQLAEIVDDLERKYSLLNGRIDDLLQKSMSPPRQPQINPPTVSTPAQPVTTPTAPPAPSSFPTPPGLPTPPSTVQPAPIQATTPPPAPSNLPPLPGQSPPSSPSIFGQPPPPPTFGQQNLPSSGGLAPSPTAGLGPNAPAPTASPMSLKAQMNMELKEAFARIRKGWDED